jgi:uncharacterized membrane protein YbhN (UPF0104 family)
VDEGGSGVVGTIVLPLAVAAVGVYLCLAAFLPQLIKNWKFKIEVNKQRRSFRPSRHSLAMLGSCFLILAYILRLYFLDESNVANTGMYLGMGLFTAIFVAVMSMYYDSLNVAHVIPEPVISEPAQPQPKIPDRQNPSPEI